ncbi:hypothetical protein ACPFL9_09130 [Paenarthrobacter sp. NyZ202]|uniref:hypothetical protein n=1 Tax=Paenarthrobacter sp. NyZ202 TaxID=3402689 RepID=UPI003CF5F1F3
MDNYAEFLKRLDSAAESLKARRGRLEAVRDVVSAMHQQNQFGRDQWAMRMARVEQNVATGQFQGRAALEDLKMIAGNTVSLFGPRTDLVGRRLAAVQARLNEINRSLHTLELNKQKLLT